MVSTHDAIAMGLATELKLFCKKYEFSGDDAGDWLLFRQELQVGISSDWYRWEPPKGDPLGVVTVGLVDGKLVLKSENLGCSQKKWPMVFFECDLAHPDLVELVRERICEVRDGVVSEAGWNSDS